MPQDILARLIPEEAAYRLTEVQRLKDNALKIPDGTTCRLAMARARRMRDALPYYELNQTVRQLEADRQRLSGAASCSADAGDISSGYFAALQKLRDQNPQAPGIDEHLSRLGIAAAASESAGVADGGKAAGATSEEVLYKRARLKSLVAAEVAKTFARLAAETEELRRDIISFAANAAEPPVAPMTKPPRKG
jgi:hypothetical protein